MLASTSLQQLEELPLRYKILQLTFLPEHESNAIPFTSLTKINLYNMVKKC